VILALGYLLPLIYLGWSLFRGRPAPANPWNATGLEWRTSSPPPENNFDVRPEMTEPPYAYREARLGRDIVEAREGTQ
jgi:cytochrome c oxidase subunit 1